MSAQKEHSTLQVDVGPMDMRMVMSFVFRRHSVPTIEITPRTIDRVVASNRRLTSLLERRIPIYGVTTGFGDSGGRLVPTDKVAALQGNLIQYLLCGTGATLPREACRATTLFCLQSISRGFSGVSPELVERLRFHLERDWIPVIPREGSLGASGDLIPLAYVARTLLGDGVVFDPDAGAEERPVPIAPLLQREGITPYTLKAKEGLSLVNGTAAMSGLSLLNLVAARYLTELTCLATSWLCLSLRGRTEAFETLVNVQAKSHGGQGRMARRISDFLADESYTARSLDDLATPGPGVIDRVQDRYSLRCAPQVLGPVDETIDLALGWLTTEASSTSDNPLVDADAVGSSLGMGGNFYGGYLGHGMDYLKISLAQVADLLDRQLTSLIDEKANRGLPANLAAWDRLPADEHHLHHGLKGLHQSVNALTAGVLARSGPNTIFSRSSESHNQDKVSLGMTAAVQCHELLEPLFTIAAMYLICLTQALDLRGIQLGGPVSTRYYQLVRDVVPFVSRDMALEQPVRALAAKLRGIASERAGYSDPLA